MCLQPHPTPPHHNPLQGLEYHAATEAGADGDPKQRFRAGLALGGVPGWRLLDPSFLFMLLRLLASESHGSGPPVVYEALLMHLAGDDPLAAAADAAAAGREGPWETPQRAGFCFVRCILSALRYVAHCALRWPPGACKRALLAQRLAVLRTASDELRSGVVATRSDLAFLRLAAQQCGRAIGKAALRGHVGDAEFGVGESLIHALLSQLHDRDAGPCAPRPPLHGVRSVSDILVCGTDAGVLWSGLDLVSSLGSVSSPRWLGPSLPMPMTDYSAISLSLPNSVPQRRADGRWSFQAVLDCVATLHQTLYLLCEAGAPQSLTYGDARAFIGAALVEHVFLELIPPPVCGGPGWNSPAAPVTSAQQLTLLSHLLRVMLAYLAVVHSCEPREGGGALHIVVQCAIMAATEATARVTPLGAAEGSPPSMATATLPLARALVGQGCSMPLGALDTVVASRVLPSFGARETRAGVLRYVAAVNAAAAMRSPAPTPFVDSEVGSFAASYIGPYCTFAFTPGAEEGGLRFALDFARLVDPVALHSAEPLPGLLRDIYSKAREDAARERESRFGSLDDALASLEPVPALVRDISLFHLTVAYLAGCFSYHDRNRALFIYRDALVVFHFGLRLPRGARKRGVVRLPNHFLHGSLGLSLRTPRFGAAHDSAILHCQQFALGGLGECVTMHCRLRCRRMSCPPSCACRHVAP